MDKNNDNEKKYLDLDALLKPDESINFYAQNIPSKGKLQRMLLAGYYALRWIDEKIDNITDFIENITALRNESERIIGLPAPEKNDYNHLVYEWDENTGELVSYRWEQSKEPQEEIEKVTEFLEEKGYKLVSIEPTEFMPIFTYTKWVKANDMELNPTKIELYVDKEGIIHL